MFKREKEGGIGQVIKNWRQKNLSRGITLLVTLSAVASFLTSLPTVAASSPVVSQNLTTDIISNNATYWPVGARICGTDSNTYSVSATFSWTSSNAYLQLVGSTPTQSLGSLVENDCLNAYFVIKNSSPNSVQTRKYIISFEAISSSNTYSISTSSTRQIYSQGNIVTSNSQTAGAISSNATSSGGVATVVVGSTYNFTVSSAATGNNAAAIQISTYFDPDIFQITNISTSGYTGGTAIGFFNNYCNMNQDSTSGSYRTCANNNSVNDSVSVTYTVKVIGAGNQPSVVTNISSYFKSGDNWKFNGNTSTSGITSINSYFPLGLKVTGAGTVTNTVSGTTITTLPSLTCTDLATCTASPAGVYATGAIVTLSATPSAGYSFVAWGGACSGTSNSCKVLMNEVKNVSATFGTGIFPLTVSLTGAGSGTVISSPSGISWSNTGGILSGTNSYSYVYADNPTVTLTATPDPLMLFTGWSGGGCSGSASTCSVTMSQAREVQANFEIDPILTVGIASTSGSKKVTSDIGAIDCTSDNANGTTGTCSDSYILDQQVVLTATSGISSWSVVPSSAIISSCASGNLTCTVKMSVDTQVFAVYSGAPVTVSIEGSSTGFGTVNSGESPANISNCGGNDGPKCTYVYSAGTNVVLTRTAQSGSTFTGWSITGAVANSGTCTSTSTTCAFTANNSVSVTAQFSLTTILTLATSGSGTISGSPTLSNSSGSWTETYATSPHQSVSLTANPATGHAFIGWTGGSCSGTSTCSLTMDNDKYVTAEFSALTYSITFYDTNSGSGGGAGGGTAPALQSGSGVGSVTLNANTLSLSGYTFAGWATSNGSTTVTYANSASVSITSNTTLNLYPVWTSVLSIRDTAPPGPRIDSISKAEVCAIGNDITISGNYFDNGSVTFDGTAITVKALSTSSISLSLPKATGGEKTIRVTTPNGTASITITYIDVPKPKFVPTLIPYLSQGEYLSLPATALNATSYSLIGTLPQGLVFDSRSGTISGTPSENGIFGFVITASGICGETSQVLELDIDKETPNAISHRINILPGATCISDSAKASLDAFLEKVKLLAPRNLIPEIYMSGGGIGTGSDLGDDRRDCLCEVFLDEAVYGNVLEGEFIGSVNRIEIIVYWARP